MACNSFATLGATPSPTPTFTVTFTSTPTPLLPTHTPTLSPTPTPTTTPTSTPLPTPTINASGETIQIPIMPEAILDGPLDQLFGERGVSYSARVPLETVRDFYQEALLAQGWEWVYTDIGLGLSPTGLTPILAQEFKRGEHRLAIVAIDDFNFFTPEDPPSVLILSAQDTSSGQIMFFFSSLMVE